MRRMADHVPNTNLAYHLNNLAQRLPSLLAKHAEPDHWWCIWTIEADSIMALVDIADESFATTFIDAMLAEAGIEYRPELCIPPPPAPELRRIKVFDGPIAVPPRKHRRQR